MRWNDARDYIEMMYVAGKLRFSARKKAKREGEGKYIPKIC